MKQRKVIPFLALLAVALCPWHIFAQTTIPPPPPCCKEDSLPPPDPLTTTLPGCDQSGAISQVTITDSALQAMGMTRSEFLDQVAASFFPGQAVDLMIPVTVLTVASSTAVAESSTSTVAADAATAGPVVVLYYRISRDQVAAEVIDTLDLLYLTDGQVCLEVVFIRDPQALSH